MRRRRVREGRGKHGAGSGRVRGSGYFTPGVSHGFRVTLAVRPEALGIGRLFDRVRDAVVVADATSGRVVLWNPAAEEVFGYPTSEALGMRVEALVPEGLKDRHREGMSRYGETGHGPLVDSRSLLELPAVRKGGEEIFVELSLNPIEVEGTVQRAAESVAKGEAAEDDGHYVLAILRDVTRRKEAEEEIGRLNAELEGRVADRTEKLAKGERRLKDLVGRLIVAQEEERKRVAYEVHDGLAQVAIAAHQHLQAFADGHAAGSSAGEAELDRALSLAQRVVREARHVIEDLRPTALDDFGLASALRLKAEELTKEGWRVAYDAVVDEADKEGLTGEKGRLAPEVETALYRVAQEALTNARKHAGVEGARMNLVRRPGAIHLEVRDEGRGFDPEVPRRNGSRGERVGMASMRERVALLGGELKITSAPGSGTSVVAEVPLREESDTKTPRVGGR